MRRTPSTARPTSALPSDRRRARGLRWLVPLTGLALLVAAALCSSNAERPVVRRGMPMPLSSAEVLDRWTPPPAAVAEPSSEAPRLRWAPGMSLSYALRMEQATTIHMRPGVKEIAAGMSPAQAADRTSEVSVEADLRLRVLAMLGEDFLVGCRMEGVRARVSASGSASARTDEAGSAALGREAFLRVTPRAEISEVRFAADAPQDFRNHYRAIVSLARVALPEGSESEWTTSEEDMTGSLRAIHTRTSAPDADELRIERTKKYVSVHGAPTQQGGIGSGVPTCRGSATGVFSSTAGVFLSIEGDEGLTFTMAGVSQEIESRTTFALRLTDVSSGAVDAEEVSRLLASLPAVEGFASHGSVRPELPRGNSQTMESILFSLEAAIEASHGQTSSTREFFDLRDLFLSDEAAVRRAIGLFSRTPRCTKPACLVVLGALGAAGDEAAQEALLSIARDESVALELRGAAVLSTFQVKAPGEALWDGMMRMAQEPSPSPDAPSLTALEAVGALAAQRAKAGDADWVAEAGRLLERELVDSKDPIRRAYALSGLGNAGGAGSLAAIMGALDDPDERVRDAAVRALRTMPEADARPALERVSGEDASPRVQASARWALELLGGR